MNYVSTRGAASKLGFEAAMLAGLARDGGLYVPETWPRFTPDEIAALAGLPYEEAALHVMRPFVADAFGEDELRALIGRAYAGFDHVARAPLTQIGPNDWLLELFHGPTLAFKDVAMQLLARLMDRVLARRKLRATIVGATSGDTGGAAIEAFRGSDRVDVVILFPHGRVSDVQRRMMTTPKEKNVHAVAVRGTFDDCQALVKGMFNDLAFRDRVKQDPEFQQYVHEHGGWEGIVASVVRNPALKPYEGQRVSEVARLRGQADDPADAVFDVVYEEGNFPSGVYHNMSDDDVKTLLQRPWVSVASDGSALNLDAAGFPHPRSFGTNPRVLGKYVRDEGVLGVEEAIRKMTSLPAQDLRLPDRGLLREGYWADLVVCDPARVADRATFEHPKQYPLGIDYVPVNGGLVVDAGDHSGARPGRVLYGAGKR